MTVHNTDKIIEILRNKNIGHKYSGINIDNIIKSFKITGIPNKLDGTEEYIFEGYNVINKLNEYIEKNSDSLSGY